MSSYLNKTKSLVNNAQNARDLVSIMNHIPLENLKDFINEKLELMNPDKIRRIYFSSDSIENIISVDVVQSIIKYIDPYQQSMKRINKTFNTLVKLNQKLKISLRQRTISMMLNKSCIPSQFKPINIWIVDPSGDSLYSEERKQGFKGIFKSLHHVLNIMESGDKIILSNGKHTMENDFSFYKKDIQIQGAG
eukprot:221568_1